MGLEGWLSRRGSVQFCDRFVRIPENPSSAGCQIDDVNAGANCDGIGMRSGARCDADADGDRGEGINCSLRMDVPVSIYGA
jgi:hypothetical protein